MLINLMSVADKDVVTRFNSRWLVNDSGCWVWSGGIDVNKNGIPYGYLWVSHTKKMRAHRFSYELHKEKIPKGLQVRHQCHNSLCVNPEHLLVGTSQDNMDDKVKANRQAKGRDHGRAQRKFTEDEVIYIRESPKKNKELAEEFDVNQSSISRIRSKENWGWLS